MTDTDTDTPTTEEPTEAQPTEAVPEPTDDSTDPAEAKAGREAAKYRRQLRETEAQLQRVLLDGGQQRDTLQTRVESAQRALVDHLASTAGRIRPAALWASGAELSNLIDADGNVDTKAVLAACEEAASTLSLSRTPRPDPSAGHQSITSGTGTFSDAFRPR
jgi:hypothetical protein